MARQHPRQMISDRIWQQLAGALKEAKQQEGGARRLEENKVAFRADHVQLELNMKAAPETINTKELRAGLARIIERTRRGASFLVLHRSRPAFQIVPAEVGGLTLPPLEQDAIYRAGAVGRSKDRLRAADHDQVLYGR